MYKQELTLHSEPTRPAGGPVSQMELHFDDEDDGENAFEESRAADGLDTAAVSNELCQAPTVSGPTGDTAWDTGVYVGVSSIKQYHTSKSAVLVSKQCSGSKLMWNRVCEWSDRFGLTLYFTVSL